MRLNPATATNRPAPTWLAASAIAIALAGISLIGPAAAGARAGSTGAEPCADQPSYAWMGDSIAETITIPALTGPSFDSYEGTIVRPDNTEAFPGKRPVVVLQHGLNGTQCALWWAAEDLAGHGYVVLVWTSTSGGSTNVEFANAVDAMRSAIAFSRSAANPFAAFSDTNRIAVGGMSLGSVVASLVQADPDPGVLTAVALDNLRRYVNGDAGGAVNECAAEPLIEVTPRVPALGFAMDFPCLARPDATAPDLKQPGFLHWREAGIPSALFVMAGFEHGDFVRTGTEEQHRLVAHFIEAWLDEWLAGDPAARQRLLAEEVLGRPTRSILSTQFHSGAFLEPGIDTTDYADYLDRFGGRPTIKQGSGPEGAVTKRQVNQGKLKFSFRSKESGVSFTCQLDSGKAKECESPAKVKKASKGRHRYLVRATDPGGLDAKKAARWRFTVVE